VLDRAEVQPAHDLTPTEQRLRLLLVDQAGEQWYVFDPESADIAFVSAQCAALLKSIQAGTPPAADVMDELSGLLGLEPVQAVQQSVSGWGLKVHLNHNCNLACEYCYADGRTSDSDGHTKGAYGGPVTYMSTEMLRHAVSKFMRDAPGDTVTIILFGGEPLLSEKRFLESIDVINAVGEECGKRIDYSMTTNATLITDRILDCLEQNSFRVCVSIDGVQETHDRQRPTATGHGSYDRAVRGLEQLSSRAIPVAIRMTAFRGRPGFEEDHLSLAALPSVASTFQFSHYGDDAVRPMDAQERDRLFGHYLSVTTAMLGGDVQSGKLGAVADVAMGIVTKRRKEFQCGAGRTFFAVGAGGDAYPCHRFVGMSKFRMGNVAAEDFAFRPLALFENNGVSRRVMKSSGMTNCSLCFAHHVCGGGCAQVAAANNTRIGELPPFYCQETRLRVQAVVRGIVQSAYGR
jgi:uncharacterized protein